MGAYIAQSDVEGQFGKDNVAIWSNLDGAVGADATRIAAAIAYAEEQVDNLFRDSIWQVPFSPIPQVVKMWCAVIAGVWLFRSRPGYGEDENQGFTDMLNDVYMNMEKYRAGELRFDTTRISEGMKGGPCVVG